MAGGIFANSEPLNLSSSDIKPPLLVVGPDRFYRSGEKFFRNLAFNAGDLKENENLKT
jgi:hypothetical protein